MTTTDPTKSGQAPDHRLRRRQRTPQRLGDRAFSLSTKSAGTLILLMLAAVALFLLVQAWPAITSNAAELRENVPGFPQDGTLWSYVGPLVFGTILAAALALLIALPVAVGIALFISHFAPRGLARALGYLVDLLAAIPSVVYGLWGALWLMPQLTPLFTWLSTYLGFIPLFEGPVARPPTTILTAAIVLSVMILPSIASVSREVFLQVPRLHEEAALALGATRWEVIKMSVIPFGTPGIIGGAMLGLGRALGETMAVAMVLSPGLAYSLFLLKPGQQQSIAPNIALKFPESSGVSINVLIFTGLVLFLITLVVNMIARWVVSRRKDFSGAN